MGMGRVRERERGEGREEKIVSCDLFILFFKLYA
jgi:hypothetical protein